MLEQRSVSETVRLFTDRSPAGGTERADSGDEHIVANGVEAPARGPPRGLKWHFKTDERLCDIHQIDFFELYFQRFSVIYQRIVKVLATPIGFG